MRHDLKKVTRNQLIKKLARYNGQVVMVERQPELVMHAADVPLDVLENIEDVEISDGAQFAVLVNAADPALEVLTKVVVGLFEDVGLVKGLSSTTLLKVMIRTCPTYMLSGVS